MKPGGTPPLDCLSEQDRQSFFGFLGIVPDGFNSGFNSLLKLTLVCILRFVYDE